MVYVDPDSRPSGPPNRVTDSAIGVIVVVMLVAIALNFVVQLSSE